MSGTTLVSSSDCVTSVPIKKPLEASERVTDASSAVSGAVDSAGRFARWWSRVGLLRTVLA